tara:strand:- start:4627 stop:5028 length:402 start_codon:yes stop_codon:yes gene_type:complete
MATIVANKLPIDIDQRVAIGFGFPLNGSAVFNQTFQTRDQIKANLINFILTNQGERVFNPNFGANLRSLLFEFENNAEIGLRQIMQDQIQSLFPSVNIQQFFIKKSDNTIQLSIIYSISNLGVSDSVSINLQY